MSPVALVSVPRADQGGHCCPGSRVLYCKGLLFPRRRGFNSRPADAMRLSCRWSFPRRYVFVLPAVFLLLLDVRLVYGLSAAAMSLSRRSFLRRYSAFTCRRSF